MLQHVYTKSARDLCPSVHSVHFQQFEAFHQVRIFFIIAPLSPG